MLLSKNNRLMTIDMIDEVMNMKSYRRSDNIKHDYVIRYTTETPGHIFRSDFEDTSLTLDDIIPNRLRAHSKDDHPIEIISIVIDGYQLPKREVEKWSYMLENCIDECDGGGAPAGGDAGGPGIGDAGGVTVDAGDVSGEMSGITTTEVLGTNKPGQGFFGKDNFYIPSRVKFPLHRWEICNGGSKRKKGKNGKPKKYEYEKGMKVVVDMFEGEEQIDKKKINRKLHSIAKAIKDVDDVEKVVAEYSKNKDKVLDKMPDDKFKETKQLFIDFGDFLIDVVRGEWKASWFAITMVAVGLAYLLMPIDLIPDLTPIPFPGVGYIDDAFVLSLVYKAIKDEFDDWRNSHQV